MLVVVPPIVTSVLKVTAAPEATLELLTTAPIVTKVSPIAITSWLASAPATLLIPGRIAFSVVFAPVESPARLNEYILLVAARPALTVVDANDTEYSVLDDDTLEVSFTSIELLPPIVSVVTPVTIPLMYPTNPDVVPAPGIETLLAWVPKEAVIAKPIVTPRPARFTVVIPSVWSAMLSIEQTFIPLP